MALSSDAVFQQMIDGIKGQEAKAKAVNGVFLYKITKDGKVAKEWSKWNYNANNICNLFYESLLLQWQMARHE